MREYFEGNSKEGWEQKLSEVFNKKILHLYEYPYDWSEVAKFEVEAWAENKNIDDKNKQEINTNLGEIVESYKNNWDVYKNEYSLLYINNKENKAKGIEQRKISRQRLASSQNQQKKINFKKDIKKAQQQIDYFHLKNYIDFVNLIEKNHLKVEDKLEELSNNKFLKNDYNELVSQHSLEDIQKLKDKKRDTVKELSSDLETFINPKQAGLLDTIDKLSELEAKHSQGDFKRKNMYEDFTDPKNFEAVVAGYYGELFPDAGFDVVLSHEYDDKINKLDLYMNYSDGQNDFALGFDVTLKGGALINKKNEAEHNNKVDFVYDENGKKYNDILKLVISPNEYFDDAFDNKKIAKYLLYKSFGETTKVVKKYFDKLSFDEKNEIVDNGEQFLSYLAHSACSKVVYEINKILISNYFDIEKTEAQCKSLDDYTECLKSLEDLLSSNEYLSNHEKLNNLLNNLKYLLSVDSIKNFLDLHHKKKPLFK